METKICTKCKRELSIDQFNWRDKTKGTRRADCKECHSGHMKEKYQEKKEIIQELKLSCKCAKCGDARGYVLDYHHIDPEEKIATIARLTSNTSNIKDVYDEIQKCIVLCANCHREFHYLEKAKGITLSEYIGV